MLLSGWGRYPRAQGRPTRAADTDGARTALAAARSDGGMIARGLGRSYGDSALGGRVLETAALDRFRAFDPASGTVTCEAGVSIADLLRVFLPRGWFPPVTPGTKHVSIGGAIASDVHGKNHHGAGSFSDHVQAIEILLADGSVVVASRERHADLFAATCGGMGLTGVILAATLRLMPVASGMIRARTLKAGNLDACLDLFAEHSAATYSVAWIDCLARGDALGRSLVMLGEHAGGGGVPRPARPRLSLPFDLPGALLNRATMKAFNALYYRRVRTPDRTAIVPCEPYFYPLDGIGGWNRAYGSSGFLQYQFVLPKAAGRDALAAILARIADSGRGSFLAVLKAFGPGNANPLSFPMEGYTLALDFPVRDDVFALLDRLDDMVVAHGGRLYLAKDARMSAATFRASYPRWETFQEVRARYGALGVFRSLQSDRLGL